MSCDGDDQSFHIPGPHSERPAGHDVPISVAGERSQRSELFGTQNPAVGALTDRQTRSKGQAVLVFFFFFFLIVCFTSYFVSSIAVLPHSPGVVYYHLLLR